MLKRGLFFSVVDIIDALNASSQPRKYWNDLKKMLNEACGELSAKIGHLKLVAKDGKMHKTDVLSTKWVLRHPSKFSWLK